MADFSVATGGDDGTNSGTGAPAFTATTVTVGHWNDGKGSDGAFNCAFRFTNVTIPQAATILTATLQLVESYSSGAGGLYIPIGLIHGNDVDNCAALSSTNFITRSGSWVDTTASVQWNFGNGIGAGNAYTSPSLVSIIQEIVDRAGWASGNALALGMTDATGAYNNSYLDAYSYEGGNASYYPKLTVTWSGGGGTSVAVFTHQRTEQGFA